MPCLLRQAQDDTALPRFSPLCSAMIRSGNGKLLPGAQTLTPQCPPGALCPVSADRYGDFASVARRNKRPEQGRESRALPLRFFPTMGNHHRLSGPLRVTDSRGNGSKHQHKHVRPYRAFCGGAELVSCLAAWLFSFYGCSYCLQNTEAKKRRS